MDIEAHLSNAAKAERAFAWQQAWGFYEAAAALAPSDHRILANQGNVAWLAGQSHAARTAYRRALLLAPRCPISLRGLGNALRDLGTFEAADRAYSESRQLDPDPLTAWNHSQVLIGLGRYQEAYAAAERRLDIAGQPVYRSGPCWDGAIASLIQTDGPLHIWSEQGLGDTLQYGRWIPRLISSLPPEAPTPLVEVEPSLERLLERGLSWLPRAPQVLAKAEITPPACAGPHVSLLSLPHHLGGAPHPGEPSKQPYLRDPTWIRWRHGPAGRIGVVWAAGRKLEDPFQAREYQQRSLPPAALEQLLVRLRQRGYGVVNLQVGPDRDPPAAINALFQEALPATMDFADTAEFVAELDRVITVDTAMAHLLGALGHPGWVLLPLAADPRWHRHTDRCPWYANLRLFRQPVAGDWTSVIEAVLAALDAEPAGAL